MTAPVDARGVLVTAVVATWVALGHVPKGITISETDDYFEVSCATCHARFVPYLRPAYPAEVGDDRTARVWTLPDFRCTRKTP